MTEDRQDQLAISCEARDGLGGHVKKREETTERCEKEAVEKDSPPARRVRFPLEIFFLLRN